ncbi:hypothetical protein I6A94_07545, partial [Frankia sp. CN4]|nr:hypothetical protein [Frankia nepalensis]
MSSARGLQTGLAWDEPAAPSSPEALPTPPLRLRRVHLRGVGPDGARFDPLDLDFTARDGAASRVLLSLTNTGGKSTLITLVSSLVVPAARAQVGGKNLGDYVLTGDTSHVVCEWEDAASRTRTVTGTVMEWKDGRRQPGHRQRSTTNMRRAWYLFRTGPGDYGVDDLPFVSEGRRTTFEAFVGQVSSALSARPRSQWAMTQTQQEWTETLERLTSIDPVLFGYQMRMNDSEAGAEKLLATFDSPDNVVRFFIAALNDDRELADFTAKLGPYAALAVARPGLAALAEFGAQVGARLEAVSARARIADDAGGQTVRARLGGGEHAAALDNRVSRDQTSLRDLEQAAQAAALAFQTARREYGQISDIRLQLLLEDARARLTAAEAAVGRATADARATAAESAAWEAVDLVLDIDRARTDRDAARAAYEAADAGLEPLRARARTARAALAGRLQALADEAEAVAAVASDEAATAERAADEAVDRRSQADGRAHDARRELESIDAAVAAADAAAHAAVTAGWLLDGERPEPCQHRWALAATAADDEADAHGTAADEADEAHQAAVRALDLLDGQLTGLRAAAGDDERARRAFDDDVTALAGHETLRSRLPDGPRDAAEVGRAADAADEEAREADRRAAEHEQVAKIAADELNHLDGTGTAPGAADALAVLAVLVDARLGAVTGLEWIEHNVVDAAARPAFIGARPELAGGVVVTDPARFDAAVAVLTDAELMTRSPVALVTPPPAPRPAEAAGPAEPSEPSGPAGRDGARRHVVLPHRATWDRAWAATRRDELDAARSAAAAVAAAARAAALAHRRASAACAQFVARWPGASRDELVRRSRASADQVAAAERRQETLRAQRDSARAQVATARRERDLALARSAGARTNEQAARGLT